MRGFFIKTTLFFFFEKILGVDPIMFESSLVELIISLRIRSYQLNFIISIYCLIQRRILFKLIFES